jgi:hypothetical protein
MKDKIVNFFKNVGRGIYGFIRGMFAFVGALVLASLTIVGIGFNHGLVKKECMMSDTIEDIVAVNGNVVTVLTTHGLTAKVKNGEVKEGTPYCFNEEWIVVEPEKVIE